MRWLPMNAADWTWAYAAAVALCAAAAVVPWAVREWRYGDRLTLAVEPLCLQCGYIIRRGGSVVCPECGSDVRQRGIVTPWTLPRLAAWPWYGLALLLGPAAGWELGAAAAEWQPFGWEFNVVRVVYLHGRLPSGKPSDDLDVFTVYASGKGRYFRKRPTAVGVWSRRSLVFLRQPGYRYGAEQLPLPPEGGFELGSVVSVIATYTQDQTDADLKAASAAVEDAVRAMASGEFPSATGTTYGERWNQDARYELRGSARPVVAGVGAAVAVLMAVSVVHRVRRPLRASRRDEWARAAAAMRLRVPEQTAA